jgi:hypothetical protein
MPCVEEELPRGGVGEIPIGLLYQQQVAELGGNRAEKRGRPRSARRRESRLDFARVRKPQARLTQEIEADVGLRDVLFEDRAVANPLAQALREDERRVAEPQQVLESRVQRTTFRCSEDVGSETTCR